MLGFRRKLKARDRKWRDASLQPQLKYLNLDSFLLSYAVSPESQQAEYTEFVVNFLLIMSTAVSPVLMQWTFWCTLKRSHRSQNASFQQLCAKKVRHHSSVCFARYCLNSPCTGRPRTVVAKKELAIWSDRLKAVYMQKLYCYSCVGHLMQILLDFLWMPLLFI